MTLNLGRRIYLRFEWRPLYARSNLNGKLYWYFDLLSLGIWGQPRRWSFDLTILNCSVELFVRRIWP